MTVATIWLRHHANEDAPVNDRSEVVLLREEIEHQRSQRELALRELEIQKEKARHWKLQCEWAFEITSRALMVSAQKPREARAARDNAISEINKKLGGLVR